MLQQQQQQHDEQLQQQLQGVAPAACATSAIVEAAAKKRKEREEERRASSGSRRRINVHELKFVNLSLPLPLFAYPSAATAFILHPSGLLWRYGDFVLRLQNEPAPRCRGKHS